MKRRYLMVSVLLAALVTSACSEKQVDQGVYTSEATLTALEKGADNYATGGFGTPDKAVVDQLKAYDQQARTIITQLRQAAQNGEAISASEKVALASAITAFQTYMTDKGIIKSTVNTTK